MSTTNKQGSKHRALVSVMLVSLMGASAGAFALGTEEDVAPAPLYTEFKKLDRNSDKQLSQEEAARDTDIAGSFAKADKDRNGSLTPEEYGNFKSSLQQARVEAYLDDSTVTARIKAELLKDTGIKGLSIKVETYKGTVILSGFVENEAQIKRAEQIASGVQGVVKVKNSLVVKG